jgi:regulator of protease activity HflC (stomatin/prohibitin superfamily)
MQKFGTVSPGDNFPFKKLIIGAVAGIVVIYLLFNLFGYNSAGYRTVRVSLSGNQSTIFQPGFYLDLFSKTTEYPDIMTLSFTKEETGSSLDLDPISIRFNDGSSADATGVIKFALPKDEKSMLKIHNDYRSLENLALTGLKTFGVECLKNSAQLMSSEMHYLGGRSTLSQYFQDQLEDGVYILNTTEKIIKDTVSKETQRMYISEIIYKDGKPVRKKSMANTYSIDISDASISDVDYEERIDKLLAQKIEATTQTSISKQKLMKAQQDALTSEAEGKKKLVDIEYQEKQKQTQQVISAQTSVELAKQQRLQAEQEYQTSLISAKTKRNDAEAEAYAKAKVMQADGALTQKLDAYVKVQGFWADAFAKYQGSITPQYMLGGGYGPGSHNAMQTFMDLQNAKAMKDLNLNTNTGK